MRMTDSNKLGAAAIITMLPFLTLLTALMYLDARKDVHQAAGGHVPAPQAECYQTPGQGEHAVLQDMTFCTH